MANYLKKYVDRVHDVPPQLQRLFKLIRDLDERVVSLQQAVEDKCRGSVHGAAPTKKQRAKQEQALRDEVNADMQKILSLSEEKVRGFGCVLVFFVLACGGWWRWWQWWRSRFRPKESRAGSAACTVSTAARHMRTHAPPPQVRIAAQIYDFVDGHIRQLDEDLKGFDGELYSDRARLGLKVGWVGGWGGGGVWAWERGACAGKMGGGWAADPSGC
jgi:hypothetical protein